VALNAGFNAADEEIFAEFRENEKKSIE